MNYLNNGNRLQKLDMKIAALHVDERKLLQLLGTAYLKGQAVDRIRGDLTQVRDKLETMHAAARVLRASSK